MRCLLLLSGLTALLLELASAQIRVLSPRTLVNALGSGKPKERGKIQGSTATFGAPFYGDRVLGRLVWAQSKGHHHCSDDDYDVPAPETMHAASGSKSHDQARLINIVMVRRGECTFVTKVRIASAKGAHAVIIVDKEDSQLTSHDLQNIIVADDGYGSSISIPSILVSRFDGEMLINTVKEQEVVVELAWDIPTDHTVAIDLWMSAASHDSQDFLVKFADSRKTLNEVVKFTPHYHVFSADPTLGGYSGLCWDTDAKYCAEDPDGSGMVSGKDVLEEDVRQLCIHELTRVARSREDSTGVRPIVFYAEKWWDYVSLLPARCPIDAEAKESRFGTVCSERLMSEVGIDVEQVKTCASTTAVKKLESERINKAWSPRALRINGWRYSGMLAADLVTRAVCSGFVSKPAECDALTAPRDPTEKYKGAPQEDGVSFKTLAGTGAAIIVFVALIACLYKRFIEKKMRTQIQEEVMLEVHNQMASYRQLSNAA